MTVRVRDVLLLATCITIHLVYRFRRRALLRYPPGPSRLPLLGNTFIIPLSNAHHFYRKLGKELGSNILYLEALGKSMIVINDITIAQDLLEKRSALYSSRPSVPMLTDVVGFKNFFGLMPYGDEWRAHRRMFQQFFSPRNLRQIEERGIECIQKMLLPNLITSPEEFIDHIRNYVGAFSMSITYGLPVQRQHDPFIHFAEDTLTGATSAAAPGRFLVNIVPSLRHIPGWMPGAVFKLEAKKLQKDLYRLQEEPYQATLKMMNEGVAPVSFVADTLERHHNKSDFDLQARYTKQTAVQVFGAVSETTTVVLTTFILGMLVRPDVLSKAQQEVDLVVGPDRLPQCADVVHMPYLSAVLKEVLRWNPPAPLGVPHTTSTDDVYMDYYIPKGCVILPNTYGMLHDEDIFPDPDEFKPERFIKDGVIRDDLPDPEVVATFGFGRRRCPGSHIARSTLSIALASILYMFDIAPAIGSDGHPIDVTPQFASASLMSEPLPFPCKITPRAGKNPKMFLGGYLEDNAI